MFPRIFAGAKGDDVLQNIADRRRILGIDHWNFYLVFSLFRLAAILQGIVKRAQIGTASSAAADSEGDAVTQLADLGMLLTD